MEHAPARWALDVLERAGYRVKIVADVCCQRTRISKGFLPEAQRDGAKAVDRLQHFARRGIPVIALEPSCASSLRDDLPDLVANRDAASLVARATTSLQEFLQREMEAGRLAPPEPPGPGVPPVLLHGHCHQKALWGTGPTKAMLAALGVDVREVDSGCCGMAGSFGHEAEHHEISQMIGARRLFPAVQECSDDTIIVADGFSCRHQVADATGRKALHFAEAYGRIARGKWHR
jgi:Fe-S oxidoreductase